MVVTIWVTWWVSYEREYTLIFRSTWLHLFSFLCYVFLHCLSLSCVLSTQYCQWLCIVHSWFSIRFSLTYICWKFVFVLLLICFKQCFLWVPIWHSQAPNTFCHVEIVMGTTITHKNIAHILFWQDGPLPHTQRTIRRVR
jgi:hypothetical protein